MWRTDALSDHSAIEVDFTRLSLPAPEANPAGPDGLPMRSKRFQRRSLRDSIAAGSPRDQDGHAVALQCCIQRRYSSDVGRKSRLKRERAANGAASRSWPQATDLRADVPAAIEPPASIAPPVTRRARRPREKRPVGARVARVAVDDATWEAFKKLCGSTPASIRLGQMVAAEVERSRQPVREHGCRLRGRGDSRAPRRARSFRSAQVGAQQVGRPSAQKDCPNTGHKTA